MYQWVDPDNGTTQLSGKPPVWYRSDAGGPRVFVIENGKVIDDTGTEVSDEQRDELRQQALLKAEEDKESAKEKLLLAKRLKATLEQKQDGEEEIIEDNILFEDEDVAEEVAEVETEESKIDEMRTLILEWEAQRTKDARKAIEPK